MPTRIKPVHDLGPCVLTLESIQSIIEILERDLPAARYSATDSAWEIYDEPGQSFLDAISQRDTLDSFRVSTEIGVLSAGGRKIEMVFDENSARILCTARPEHEHWFEHFLIDIKKQIRPPSFVQLAVHRFGHGAFYIRLPLLFLPLDTSMLVSTPYCKIVIRKRPPSPFVENVKANLVSNVIWAVIVFVLGVVATLVIQRLFGR